MTEQRRIECAVEQYEDDMVRGWSCVRMKEELRSRGQGEENSISVTVVINRRSAAGISPCPCLYITGSYVWMASHHVAAARLPS